MRWLCPRCLTPYSQSLARCPQDGQSLVEDLTDLDLAGRYTLQKLVGVGGMGGTVWRGWQQSTQRQVAVKVLPTTDTGSAERFEREARIVSSLNHPHITTVHDYGHTGDGRLYLVMELLEGHTLRQLLKRVGILPVGRVLHMVDQALRALDHAHRRHVVHRDLKTGNIFLVQSDEDDDFVKILDFGIAKYMAGDLQSGAQPLTEPNQSMTSSGQVCGTPPYMAPEQTVCGAVDGRTDLYAMGIVMYRCLVGQMPFDGPTRTEMFRKVLTQPPLPFAAIRPDLQIPTAVEALVMKALQKSPEQRFASARDMRAQLRAVRQGLGIADENSEDSFAPADIESVTELDREPLALRETEQAAAPATRTTVPHPHRRTWLALAFGLPLLALTAWLIVVALSPQTVSAPPARKSLPSSSPTTAAGSPALRPSDVVAAPESASSAGTADAAVGSAAVAADGHMANERLATGPDATAVGPDTADAAAAVAQGTATDATATAVPSVPPTAAHQPAIPRTGAKVTSRNAPRTTANPTAAQAEPTQHPATPADAAAMRMRVLGEDRTRVFQVGPDGTEPTAAPPKGQGPKVRILEDPAPRK